MRGPNSHRGSATRPEDRPRHLLHRKICHAAQCKPVGRDLFHAAPYPSRRVLTVVAAITPRQWRDGLAHCGFARRAGTGRVPDEIRLRTSHGGWPWEASDHWHADRPRAELAIRRLSHGTRLGVDATVQWGADTFDRLSRTATGTGFGVELNRLSGLLAVAELVHGPQPGTIAASSTL